MSLDIGKYERTPFYVDAVQITLDNMEDVAKWCGGEIKRQVRNRDTVVQYIEVDVTNPVSARQGKAFVGNWALKTNSGFKVYTERAFESCFKEVKPPTPEEIWSDDMLPLEPAERNDIGVGEVLAIGIMNQHNH
jgi:hypothetical protein